MKTMLENARAVKGQIACLTEQQKNDGLFAMADALLAAQSAILEANAQDLEAGNKLKVMAIDEKTGEHVLVNAKTYTVNKNGNVKLTLPAGMTYQLMDTKEAAAVEKQILATVKVQKTSATVAEGKKITVQMSKNLDMDNVAKITYSTSKKSVATVSKNGQVTAKNTGSVVITAKVTLKNGKTKTVKMKITVK